MGYRYSRKYVNDVQEIKDQVERFMATTPKLCGDACGSNPIYFVCTKTSNGYRFGLSKFCALQKISLNQYVNGRRHTTDGNITQKRIRTVTGQPWVDIRKMPVAVRAVFLDWFSSFYENAHTKKNLKLMMLD